MLKSNKGITLIALVITIIVLLILATVSITMLTGSNGVLTKARESEVMNKRGEISEKINLALQGIMSELLKDISTSENNKTIDFTDEPKYGLNEILKGNNMKEAKGSENPYSGSVPTDIDDAKLPETGKVYAFVLYWNPTVYDKSSKYGSEEKDVIWGAITYEANAEDKIPFKADKPAKANMSQAGINDFSKDTGKYYAGATVKKEETSL